MATDKLLDGVHSGVGDFFRPYDRRILGWIKEALVEGDEIINSDPIVRSIDKAQDYIIGQQLHGKRPWYVPNVVLNKTHKAALTHVSVLTDIRPFFAFHTYNNAYKIPLWILNRLAHMWWINTEADMAIGDAIRYAEVCGSGDLSEEWNPDGIHGPDTYLIARDPRDTVPIRPGRGSVQEWEGMILRQASSISLLRNKYPQHAEQIKAEAGSMWSQIFTRFKRVVTKVTTPMSTLDYVNRGGRTQARPSVVPETNLYRLYLTDRSINNSIEPVIMGDPNSNWCYRVEKGEQLYPRKRLIVATEQVVLYDGPSQYWHGKYPLTRVTLDRWPWQYMGFPRVNSQMPIQDAINAICNDFLTTFSQWTQRGAFADQKAVPTPVFKRFDAREPNWRMQVRSVNGPGIQMVDGPNLPPWSLQFFQTMLQQYDDLSESTNFTQLAQLKQMPGADTIEAYYKALTPGMRIEGRMIEKSLRQIAEQWKVNSFQFYSKSRRILMLGQAGEALQDLDFDPDTLVPSYKPDEKNYTPELDFRKSRVERAKWFHTMFSFFIEPDSILGMHAQEKKMMTLQLSRMGYCDIWTLAEVLGIPNMGTPPPVNLPPLNWRPEEHPGENPPMEIRIPETIPERLKAMQEMGLGQTVSPAGRKSSGSAPPKMIPRPNTPAGSTVSESK